MRTNSWLAERLTDLHLNHFSDVPIENLILVRFGRASRTRFGSIIARPKKGHTKPVTYITINSLFQDLAVPDFVIDATLAHEFVHYSHGFHSPLKQAYKFPHKGDIVNKELRKRGIGSILDMQTEWAKNDYRQILLKYRLL